MPRFNPWVRSIPWKREWQPTPVILPGEFHGQRSLAGYSQWGHKESGTTCPARGKSKVTSIVGGGGSAHLLRGRGRSPWAEPWAEVLQEPRLTLKNFFLPCIWSSEKEWKCLSLLLCNRSVVPDSATPWIAALQDSHHNASLLKLMSIGSVMPSNHLFLCCPFCDYL